MATRSYFLVVFDPRAEVLVRVQEYSDAVEAATARRSAEEQYQGTALQVVMFAAHSIDNVKRTHPHYFRGRSTGDTLEFAALA